MPRYTTLLLALLLVALSLIGSVVAQDPNAVDPNAAADPNAVDPDAVDPNAGGDTGAESPAAGDVASPSPAPSPSPAADGASAGASPAGTAPAGSQSAAAGDPNGPELAISEPSGATVVAVGSNLTASWSLDTSGTWTQTTIEFMTGPNSPMVPLQTLGTVDATTTGSFSFIVPDVTIYSQIYFLQFTSAGGAPSWSTRFTVTGKDGSKVDPPNTVVVDGQNVGWGTGALVNGGAAAGGPQVAGAGPTSSQGARPTGVNGTGITLYTDKIVTSMPTDVSTHGVAAATQGALPGSGALALRPAAAVIAIVAAAAVLV